MFEWVPDLLKAMNAALQEGAALSILIGFAVALGGTQYLKFQFAGSSRRVLNSIALILGFVTTYMMWPVHTFNAVRFFLALTVGLLAPFVYKMTVLFLFWKWPSLEKYFSPSGEPLP
jgi:hypothetical protein